MKNKFFVLIIFNFIINFTPKALSNLPKLSSTNLPISSKHILIAIIDTGADINHKDLKEFIWKNPGEIPDNGIDDDRNGYTDDINGWNFIDQNNVLTDQNGHGTHITGLINSKDKNIQLMILKYYNPQKSADENLQALISAIHYATMMNAQIINYSGGGNSPSSQELVAIKAAEKKHILFVSAAGNESRNSDINGFYPANYKLKNIIAVAATKQNGELLESSNFGVRSVHISAIGENIKSTLPNNKYGYMSGTSQATAIVTKKVALLLKNIQTRNSNTIFLSISNLLVKAANKSYALKGKVSSLAYLEN